MSIPKPLKRASTIFICVAVSLITFGFVINLPLFDEELNPVIVEEMKPIEMPPANQNAYIALWGMAAADDLDFIQAGQRVLDRHQEKLTTSTVKHELTEQDLEIIFGGAAFDKGWLEGRVGCGPQAEFGCLERSRAYIERVKSDVRLQLQIQRYRTMISLPYYVENRWDSPGDELPSYLYPLAASQNYLSILYFDESPEFLEAMAADMNFWRRVLDADAYLLTKMIAVVAIWRNCLFISEYMLSKEIEESDISKIKSILMPLTASELNIEETWRQERYSFVSGLSFDNPRWLENPLTQINATKNMHYRVNWEPLEKMSRLSANELYQLVEQATESGLTPIQQFRNENEKMPQIASPTVLYNLIGKLDFVGSPQWDGSGYMERLHDLGGIVNLVNLQLEILESDDFISNVIQASKFLNPHTLMAMNYDEDENTISFPCRDKITKCTLPLTIRSR